MIMTGHQVGEWIAAKVGKPAIPPYEAIGYARDGSIIGGALFNHYTGDDVHVTVAGEPRAWSRPFLRELAAYAFGQLKCARVTIITEKPEVLDLALRLGGQVEGRIRDKFGPGRNAALVGILASDWRI